jgi:GntR family transcriptional repressor for pyruvate dehydrogenase complex
VPPIAPRETLPLAIAAELRRQIESGELRPGDRLPGHRELAGTFSVSVGSVREAISMLVSTGLIETQAARGTYVADGRVGPVHEAPFERKEAEELIEARRLLELEIVELASRRASSDDVLELRTCVDRLAGSVEDAAAYNEADRILHGVIARVAGNRFLLHALEGIRARLQGDLELAADAAVRRFGSLDFSVASHCRLVDAIEAGSAGDARRFALELMERSHGFILGLYALGPTSAR